MFKRLLIGVGVILTAAATTACTPRQIEQWVEWHQQDPAAAEEFANLPAIQAALRNGNGGSSGGGGGDHQ